MSSRCRIVFDRSKCATIGLCEMAAPDFFSIPDDGEGTMVVLHETADASRRTELEKAANDCPTQSIHIIDA
jgi:ferredoxin